MSQPCAIVAGGAGFVGSHLCRRLLREGYAVVCMDNLLTGRHRNIAALESLGPFRFVHWDVTRRIRLPGEAEVVFHLASPASPADYLRYPLETLAAGSAGTQNTLELAREKGARYILASTSEVYGTPQVHPQPETYWGHVNPVGPRSVYDEAKRFSEALVTAHRESCGIDTAIARIFNTYGPRMRNTDGRAVPTFIAQALSGRPLTVTGTGAQTRSLCYIDDLIEGLLALRASSVAGPVNLGNPHEITMLGLARMILHATGSASSITFSERPEDDPDIRCPDITRARRELAWAPKIGLSEGLDRTIAWFRTHAGTRDAVVRTTML
ncbi:UDP-glucuronic acid decarboxylase family protein [Streptomyces sp. XD-27]|uniref:UDP-glucuronic acid decarboxylase family protein n=1 Tax=Streptomyces sp. XD-27 TaxID=3062779 RepID=UPI0026F439D6|nr:UDP-glucuronic acid decarboxylase family protein [Streptomyces sp. XD-27]WKX69367.1 SDR family oxidoreductase [Streptomyces sp. XD-27]